MIETPAAVMISDELAKMVDFFSIGTNDLTQYTLAIDRQNEKLDRFYNPHHKAILKMIQMVVDSAHQEGKWAGICGELGADPELTETFVCMGVDELSVAPSMILKLRRSFVRWNRRKAQMEYVRRHKKIVLIGLILLAVFTVIFGFQRKSVMEQSVEDELKDEPREETVKSAEFYLDQLTKKEMEVYLFLKDQIEQFQGGILTLPKAVNGKNMSGSR